MRPHSSREVVVEFGRATLVEVERLGVGPLETAYGLFYEFVFKLSDRWSKYVAIVKAELDDELQPVFRLPDLLLRIDSGCETGQIFGDQSCDCKGQLERALAEIAAKGEGLVVHVPHQDGRGLGLGFKLATLMLQTELGVDTVEASALLDPQGMTRDIRDYGGVIAILRFFEVASSVSIRLLSNNPNKLTILQENGFARARLCQITVPPTEQTRKHLRAKQLHLGHIGLVTADRVDVDEKQSAVPSEKEERLPIPT